MNADHILSLTNCKLAPGRSPAKTLFITMEATNQIEGGGGDDGISSSSQIFHILISDFLSPIKSTSTTTKFSNTKEDLILQQKLISSGNILLMIVRNALRCHQSEKFRKVRMSNPKVRLLCIGSSTCDVYDSV